MRLRQERTAVKSSGKGGSMAWVMAALLLVLQSLWIPAIAQNAGQGGEAPQVQSPPKEPILSAEEKMRRRYPQPVRVGFLIGLPVLDDQDSTIGYIRSVVRTPAGKIQLVVPYGRWFGWVNLDGPFAWGRRPVGVPLETVAILGRQVDALDMSREEFDKAPDYAAGKDTPLAADDVIKIALGRR